MRPEHRCTLQQDVALPAAHVRRPDEVLERPVLFDHRVAWSLDDRTSRSTVLERKAVSTSPRAVILQGTHYALHENSHLTRTFFARLSPLHSHDLYVSHVEDPEVSLRSGKAETDGSQPETTGQGRYMARSPRVYPLASVPDIATRMAEWNSSRS